MGYGQFLLIWCVQSHIVRKEQFCDAMSILMAQEGGVEAFGEELRRAREERGLSVEAICDATKVSARNIRALEAGALGELPGGVFRRGFVRSYLGALRLEEAPWMRRFEESCRLSGVSEPAATEWAEFAENVKNSRIVRRRHMGIRWAAAGVILAALALGGWCGWRLATHRGLLPTIPIWRVLKSSVDNAPSR
jgi:cytoskeletal protein RodZ